MSSIQSKIRFVKNDFIPRNAARIRKPGKIIMGMQEYRARRDLAESIRDEDCLNLDIIRRDGYAMLDLPREEKEILLRSASEKLKATQDYAQRGAKVFFSSLLTKEDLDIDGIYLRLALNEQFLRTTAAYLGYAPFLEYAELLHSKPVETINSSQQWHKDRTDSTLLKIFVYCLDVTLENGPFSFMSAADSLQVPALRPHYLTDDRMGKYVPLSRTIQLTGNAGTAFFVDSSRCYHFGSRCAKPRLAFVIYYNTGFGYFPRESKWTVSESRRASLSPLQRFALGV
jgi:hypothetical protein